MPYLFTSHYRDKRGVPALFTDHLHYIITTPPPLVVQAGALILQERFMLHIRYHFSYAPMAVLRHLFSSLAKASHYHGHADAHQIDLLLDEAWSDLGMVGYKWRTALMENPLFFKLLHKINPKTNILTLQYSDTPQALYKFGRNDDVHAPEETLLLTPAPQVQSTAPPQGADHWIWAYNPAQLNWRWETRPPLGSWNWPIVPIYPDWKILWGSAAANLNANAPAPTFSQKSYNTAIEQQMSNPNQPSFMLAKELGVFFAHASALILIRLQSTTPEYIDVPYQLYRSLMDSAVPTR